MTGKESLKLISLVHILNIPEKKGAEKEPVKETPREDGIKMKRGLETRNVQTNRNKNE